MIFFLACLGTKTAPISISEKSVQQQNDTSAEEEKDTTVAEETKIKPSPIPSEAITETVSSPPPKLEPLSISRPLPKSLQQDWPPQKWSHAKAYTFNFVPFGPGQKSYIYRADTWNGKIQKTYPITEEQAEYAVHLIHQTAGNVETSKCTFPRHGIVYFDENDTPIASINYCFSCGGVLVWPPYFEDMEEEYKKYDIQGKKVEGKEYIDPLVIQIYEELTPSYEQLFLNVLNMSRYP